MDEITLVHVDDDAAFAELTATALEREEGFVVESLTDPAEALRVVGERGVDCVVSDYDMPEMDGLALLRSVRERNPELPFVLFTGKGSEEIAGEAISEGVDDYIQKDGAPGQFELLANRIRNLVSRRRAEAERAESERRLSTLVSNIPGMAYRSHNEPTYPDEYVSEGCEALTGYDREQLVSGEVVWDQDITHPDDQGAFWDDVQAALEAREHFELTYRIVTADGEQKWVWERGRGVYEAGEAVAIEGFISDVTERVRMEQRLRELNETMSDLHEVAARLAAVDDEETVYEVAIEAAEEVLELSVCYFVAAADERFELRAISAGVPDERFQELPLDAGALGAAFQRGEPLLVDDAFEHPEAEPADDTYPAGISLPVGDVGAFQALATERDAFDEDDLELAKLLVAHVREALLRVQRDQ